ncbi:hypothetical protein PS2_006730 [Malus domestica]
MSVQTAASAVSSPDHAAEKWFSVPKLRLRDHRFTVPLDYSVDRTASPKISVFAHEVVSVSKEEQQLPYLLYLQGGLGSEAPDQLNPVDGYVKQIQYFLTSSSSASASRTVQPQPSQKEQDRQNNLGIGGGSVGMSTANPSGGLAIHHQYYPGSSHGYLSSFAGLQSLSQSQPFNVGGGHDPASNMSLLQGFNLSVPMVALQPQQRQHFFQVSGARSNSLLDQAALYPSERDLWPPQSVVNRSSVNPSSFSIFIIKAKRYMVVEDPPLHMHLLYG